MEKKMESTIIHSISKSVDKVQSKIPGDTDVGMKFWKKRRNVVGLMVFMGFFMSNSLRVNLTIALVVMTSSTGNVKPEFEWNFELQNYIIGSFFYGYIATQFLGGFLSSKIGGKIVLGVGIGAAALLTLATPSFARTSVYLFIGLRVAMGLFEGVTFPSVNSIWANWAPPLERSRLSILPFSGSTAAAVISLPLSSVIAERLGWEAVFYINGFFGLIWFGMWMYFVSDKPDDDPWISSAELEYLKKTLSKIEDNKKHVTRPWKEMLTSVPVWATFVAHFCGMWGFHTLVLQLPRFMSDVLKFDIEKTGFISALPYLGLTIVMVLSGHIADYLLSNNYLSTTMVRKTLTCAAFIGQAIFMTLAGFMNSSIAVVLCFIISLGIDGLSTPGYIVNYLDIAPQHASILLGMGKTIATLPGVISPILVGYIVKEKTAEEWRIVFIIVSIINLFGAIIYGVFASSKKQKWADESYGRTKINNYIL